MFDQFQVKKTIRDNLVFRHLSAFRNRVDASFFIHFYTSTHRPQQHRKSTFEKRMRLISHAEQWINYQTASRHLLLGLIRYFEIGGWWVFFKSLLLLGFWVSLPFERILIGSLEPIWVSLGSLGFLMSFIGP